MKASIKHLLIILFGLISTNTLSQKQLTEIDLTQSIDGLNGMTYNDSIFISIRSLLINETNYNFYWIRKDGSKRKVNLPLSKNQYLFGISSDSVFEYYYYLIELKKQVVLKALKLNKKTGEITTDEDEIVMIGNVYGSYIEGDDLYLIQAIKGTYTLNLIQINGMTIKKSQPYKLSFDLGSYKIADAKLKVSGTEFMPSNAKYNIKLTKESNTLWISVDEMKDPYERDPKPNMIYKTTVIKLNLHNPDNTLVKSFIDTNDFFSSRIYNGLLFRVSTNLKFYQLNVFNIETGKPVISKTITNKFEFENGVLYHRSDYRTIKSPFRTPFTTVGTGFVEAYSDVPDEYVLAIGSAIVVKPRTPLIPGVGFAIFLASALTQALVADISEGKYVYVYGYFRIKTNGELITEENTNYLSQKIDGYELVTSPQPKAFKAYLATIGSAFAFYQDKGSNKLRVVSFTK